LISRTLLLENVRTRILKWRTFDLISVGESYLRRLHCVDPFVARFLGDQGHVDGQPDGQQGGAGQGRHPGQFVRS